mgnify:CR=1 FL=1
MRIDRVLRQFLPLFFWSSLVNLYLALRHRQPALASRRGICLFLALVMLLSPEGLVQLAQADVQYSQLCTNSWGKGGQAITSTYDENGSVETRTTGEGATVRYLECGMRAEEKWWAVPTLRD